MDPKAEKIKMKSQEIESLLDEWGFISGTSERDKKKSQIKSWISNFRPSEIDDAFIILTKLQYKDVHFIHTAIEKLAKEIAHVFHDDFSGVRFFPLGKSPSSSGGMYLYDFRKGLSLSEDNFPYSEFNNTLDGTKAFVFFDDIIGSGNQAIQFANKNLKSLGIKSYYVVLFAFEDGLERVKNEACFENVIYGQLLSNEERAFHPKSQVFTDSGTRERLKTFCTKYGKQLFPKHPLGYDDSQALLTFLHNTPNNTLPIIWASTKNEKVKGFPWNPVFERKKKVRKHKQSVPLPEEPKPESPKKQVKVLSIMASPDASVMYEREQIVLLDSFAPFIGEGVVIDMPDPVSSTLTELDKYLGKYPYDILIITAHGSKEGKLLFEDEEGNEVAVTGSQIAEKLQKLPKRPSVVIFSACHSAHKDDDAGLLAPARELYETGAIGSVIGMRKEISQFAAIDFNKGFIGSLLEGCTMADAFGNGKQTIREGEERRLQDKGNNWKFINEDEIPQLFINPESETFARSDFHEETIERERLISADFEGAKYVERGFIGRRNELRSIMKKVLIDKESRIVVKGPGGVGKSALTTRVCANLRNEGWKLLIFVGTIRLNEVITKIFELAKKCGVVNAEEILNRTDISWQVKLRDAIKLFLADTKIAIIFDNFEDNQELETGNVSPELKEFIEICNDLQYHESALFITTRYKIPGLHHTVDLLDFSAVETRKMFFQFKALSRLEDKQITNIHKKIGANPRVLELLETLAAEEFGSGEFDITLLEEIMDEAVKIVTGDNKTEEAFAPWFIGRLVSYLNEEEKDLLKTVSLYRLPVKSEGLFMDKGRVRRVREKLLRLSLIVYMPTDNYYFSHRLTSDYVVKELFEETELKRQRKKAGEYMECVNSFESIYQYTEAGETDKAFEIANAVQDYLSAHGYVYEARGLLESFLATKLTEQNRGTLCHSIGVIEDVQGDLEKALCYFNESLEIFEKLGDVSSKSKSLHHIGMIYQAKGDYGNALRCFNENLEVCEILGDISGKNATQHHIARIYKDKGDYENALSFFYKNLEACEKLSDLSGTGKSLLSIGIIYYLKGDYENALKCFRDSLEICIKLEDISGMSNAFHNIGAIYQAKGEYENALKCFRDSFEICKKLGYIRGMSKSLHNIGIVYECKGDYDNALRCFNENLDVYEKLGDINGKSMSLHHIGRIYQLKGDYENALRCFKDSFEICEKLEDISGKASTKGQLGKLYIELKRYNDAFECFIESYLIFRKISGPDRKRAAMDILEVKKFVEEEDYNNSLRNSGIDIDELVAEMNTLIQLTMLALNGKQEAGEQIKGVLSSVPQDMSNTEDGKGIHAYIKYLYDLAHAEDKNAFIKTSDKHMVETMVSLVGKENVPVV